MAYTVRDVCNMALLSLNDQGGAALNVTEQLKLYNRTMRDLVRHRPDIFVGNLASAIADKTIGDSNPYDDDFAPLHANLMVSEALGISDEAENLNKAGLYAKKADA